MAKRYHINGQHQVMVCTASKRACQFSHFSSREAALTAVEMGRELQAQKENSLKNEAYRYAMNHTFDHTKAPVVFVRNAVRDSLAGDAVRRLAQVSDEASRRFEGEIPQVFYVNSEMTMPGFNSRHRIILRNDPYFDRDVMYVRNRWTLTYENDAERFSKPNKVEFMVDVDDLEGNLSTVRGFVDEYSRVQDRLMPRANNSMDEYSYENVMKRQSGETDSGEADSEPEETRQERISKNLQDQVFRMVEAVETECGRGHELAMRRFPGSAWASRDMFHDDIKADYNRHSWRGVSMGRYMNTANHVPNEIDLEVSEFDEVDPKNYWKIQYNYSEGGLGEGGEGWTIEISSTNSEPSFETVFSADEAQDVIRDHVAKNFSNVDEKGIEERAEYAYELYDLTSRAVNVFMSERKEIRKKTVEEIKRENEANHNRSAKKQGGLLSGLFKK